jgi:hypothetical protein
VKIVIDPLFLRRPKINYISPAVCEAVFSGTGSPIIILSDISKLPGPTGLVFSGVGSRRFTWNRYPGALCYNVYTAVIAVHDIFECQQLVNESSSISYQIIAECIVDPVFVVPSAGCYRVSAITPDGESDLSDPACVCDFTPPTIHVCNDEQTATCAPPQVGPPVTIPAGTFCVDTFPEDEDDAKAEMNAQAMQQAQSELVCGGGGGGGLRAYYKLDENSGTRADATGDGNNLHEVGGNSVPGGPGALNQAAVFPGLPVHFIANALTPVDLSLTDWTISTWLFADNTAPGFNRWFGGCLSNDDSAGNGQITIQYWNNAFENTIDIIAAYVNLVFSINVSAFAGQWVHLVMAYDKASGAFTIRVNGGPPDGIGPGGSFLNPGAGPFSLGGVANSGDANNYFKGSIDETGLWPRQLTLTEMTALYNGGTPLPFGSPGFPV